MIDGNRHLMQRDGSTIHILLDANIISYSQTASVATGLHLLDYLDSLSGYLSWHVSGEVAANLYNNKIVPGLFKNILNSSPIDMKMDHFPYKKSDGSVGFVKLNKIANDDWSQIMLGFEYPELLIITNDSKMFKSGNAILDGRVIGFHDFLNKIEVNWRNDDNWSTLYQWFVKNVPQIRNNSSWKLPPDALSK